MGIQRKMNRKQKNMIKIPPNPFSTFKPIASPYIVYTCWSIVDNKASFGIEVKSSADLDALRHQISVQRLYRVPILTIKHLYSLLRTSPGFCDLSKWEEMETNVSFLLVPVSASTIEPNDHDQYEQIFFDLDNNWMIIPFALPVYMDRNSYYYTYLTYLFTFYINDINKVTESAMKWYVKLRQQEKQEEFERIQKAQLDPNDNIINIFEEDEKTFEQFLDVVYEIKE